MCFINKLSGIQMSGSVFPSGNAKLSRARDTKRGSQCWMARNGDSFLSAGTYIMPLRGFWQLLENLGLTTVYIKNINSWSREDLKSHNISISQWASAVRFGKGVLSGTRGLKQPPTSCFPCLWLLTREEVRVRPEWLFQPPHLDARAELEQKWIDSLFYLPFINS